MDGQLDFADSARYVMVARSLAQGTGYIGQGGFEDRTENQIPFAYPFMLAPLVLAFGPNAFAAFELLSVVSMVLALPCIFLALKKWMPESEAASVVLACAFLVQYQKYATSILTEAPYIAVSFLCLAAIHELGQEKPSLWHYVLFALTLGVSFHLRVIAVLLLAVAVIFVLLQRRYRRAVGLILLGVFACMPWVIWTLTKGMGYAPEFVERTAGPLALVRRFLYNAAAYATKIPPDDFLYPAFEKYLPYEPMFFLKAAVGLGLTVVCLRGFWLRWRHSTDLVSALRDVSVAETYLVLYAAISCAWTVHGDRYPLPVMPVLIWAFLRGAGRLRPYASGMIMAVGLAGCVFTIYKVRTGQEPVEARAYRESVQWLKANASPSETVSSRYPGFVTASTGQRGTRFEETHDPEIQRKALRDQGIRWLIVDHQKLTRESAVELLQPLLEKYPADFELKYRSLVDPATRVYRVVER